MTNTEYIAKMLQQNERIYVDTASLMNYDSMSQFITSSKELLNNLGRQLIIPSSVYTELVRHLYSDCLAKRESALEAINLISENRDLFDVHCVTLTDDEIAKAFADVHILSDLTINKPIHNQLLITNDRDLSRDAYNLNLQQSCKGRKVMVCYINSRGQLHRSDCVVENTQKQSANTTTVNPQISTVISPEIAYSNAVPKKTSPKWAFDWQSAGVGFLGAVGTLFLYKSSKQILTKI